MKNLYKYTTVFFTLIELFNHKYCDEIAEGRNDCCNKLSIAKKLSIAEMIAVIIAVISYQILTEVWKSAFMKIFIAAFAPKNISTQQCLHFSNRH